MLLLLGTIHLGRPQILRNFWPLPPLSAVVCYCLLANFNKIWPLPLQIADVLNGWSPILLLLMILLSVRLLGCTIFSHLQINFFLFVSKKFSQEKNANEMLAIVFKCSTTTQLRKIQMSQFCISISFFSWKSLYLEQ